MGRRVLELVSSGAAGIVDETDDWYWVRVLDKFEMYTHKEDQSVTPCLVRDGYWESWITLWVMENVDAETFFLDVGANTGYYGFLAQNLGASVCAYEPNKLYIEMIIATGKRNNLPMPISPVALSDKTEEAVLHIPGNLHGSASLNEVPGYETTPVKVVTRPLDEILNDPRLYEAKQVMKIDAEGAEEKILHGAKNFIANAPSLVIALEYTPGAYSDHFLDDLRKEWHINWINYDGVEEPVEDAWLHNQEDWRMLVLRKK